MTGAHFCSCVSRRWRLHFRRSGRAGRDCEFVGGGRKFLRLCEHDVAEQIGGANGDEPFSSVSIATSAMAHPRRSPLAFGNMSRTMSAAIKIEISGPPTSEVIHRFRNFGEDIYRLLRDTCSVDIDEIDAATSSFVVRDIRR